MANKVRYKTGFGFIDLLFNLLVGFTFMFILAFILINPVAKKANIDPKAEYLIVMTWDDQSKFDIDLWVQDNTNNIVSFRLKDKALITLDRDDMGQNNDTYQDVEGKLKTRYLNREVVAIRSDDKRTYFVSVQWFSKGTTDRVTPIDVTVEVIRVNPFSTLKTRQIRLEKLGDERGVFKIEVEDSKRATVTDSDVQIIYNTNNLRKSWQ
jgi:hypothetical protein